MSVDEEHQELHDYSEWIKFLVLAAVLVLTILIVALARPLIFDEIVPAVLGWDQPAPPVVVTPTPSPTPLPPTATATPEVTATVSAETATATPTLQTYRVQPGDSLTSIARRFNVSVAALVDANGITNANRIRVGDVLVIPAAP